MSYDLNMSEPRLSAIDRLKRSPDSKVADIIRICELERDLEERKRTYQNIMDKRDKQIVEIRENTVGKIAYECTVKALLKRSETANEKLKQYANIETQLAERDSRIAELEEQISKMIYPPAKKLNINVDEINNMRKTMSIRQIAETLHCSMRTIYKALEKANMH